MSKYHITENSKRNRHIPLTKRGTVLCLLLLVMLFSARAAWRAYSQMQSSSEVTKNAEAELVELQERKAFIESELEKLSTAQGREEKLREKFGVGRPGEQVAIIIESEEDDSSLDSENKIWSSVKNFFTSLFQK